MKNDYLNLRKLLKIDKWQSLQDAMAKACGLAIITVDYKGIPLTRHSGCRDFCQAVRQDPALNRICQKCDARGGVEAVRISRPYIYLCHFQIIDAAIPITIEDKYVGAIMVGQALPGDNFAVTNLEKIYSDSSLLEKLASDRELSSLYRNIPRMEQEAFEAVVTMIEQAACYIVEEALERQGAIELLMPQSNSSRRENFVLPEDPEVYAEQLRQKRIQEQQLSAIDTQPPPSESEVLRPAFAYINEYKGQNPPLRAMAALCHISPSYFCRLFKKEVGMGYAAYLGYLKSQWGKEMLVSSRLSITAVSEALGYGEPSYFIKIFKRYHGVTPSIYRKYYPSREVDSIT